MSHIRNLPHGINVFFMGFVDIKKENRALAATLFMVHLTTSVLMLIHNRASAPLCISFLSFAQVFS